MIDLLNIPLSGFAKAELAALVVFVIVFFATLPVVRRDMAVWFDTMSRIDEEAEVEEAVAQPDAAGNPATPVRPFVERRNPANPSTGFGRRKGDAVAVAQRRAA